MLTQLEQKFFTLACSFFADATKKKEIDWEKRRYEISKEILAKRISLYGKDEYDVAIDNSVEIADKLIAKLKETKSTN